MEQKNKRYIEIDSCVKCEHNGQIASSDGDGVVFICSNPAHAGLEIPRKFIGMTAYPIIVTELCHIPSWCTLPKELAVQK